MPKLKRLAEIILVAALIIALSAFALLKIVGGCSRVFGF